MNTKDKYLYLGAILTMLASWLIIVAHKNNIGQLLLLFSNVMLWYYAISTFLEYCRNLAKPVENSSGE